MFRALATRGASAFRGATMQVSLVKRVFDSIVGIWTLDIDFLTICNLSAGASRPGCTFCETYELLSRIRCRVWREVCKSLISNFWALGFGISAAWLAPYPNPDLLRYIAYFDRADIDGWEIRKVYCVVEFFEKKNLLVHIRFVGTSF